jgi:hypothetical protein
MEEKYLIGGYAPGNYWHEACKICGKTFFGDKQAFNCEPCGEEVAAQEAIEPALSPEHELICRIVKQWGNVINMPKMVGWLKEYAAKRTIVDRVEIIKSDGLPIEEASFQAGYSLGVEFEQHRHSGHSTKETVEAEWESLWKSIVTNKDGTVNLEQLKKELYDFSFVMEQVAKVYCHITGNRMSKVTYYADDVIRQADDYYKECHEKDTEKDKVCTVNAEFLGTFASFEQWVSKASSWIGGHRKGTIICVDKAGNLCLIGEDFMAARDFDLFPVNAYKMIKTIEAV